MSDIIQKISSYNLFNYLLPGIIFSVFLEKVTMYKIIQEDILINTFLFYFIGLCISRVGSIIVEPTLKWFKILKFGEYKDFIDISNVDPKIEILSESNNMYRTFVSAILGLLLVVFYENLQNKYNWTVDTSMIILILILLFLFLFSYIKQTNYIRTRIESQKDKD